MEVSLPFHKIRLEKLFLGYAENLAIGEYHTNEYQTWPLNWDSRVLESVLYELP